MEPKKRDGISLNNQIHSGPDLTNKLRSMLNQFRLQKFCILGDIKGMFHMIQILKKQRDSLRFLWFPDEIIAISHISILATGYIIAAKFANFLLFLM